MERASGNGGISGRGSVSSDSNSRDHDGKRSGDF